MPRSPSRSRSPPPRRRERSRDRERDRYRDRRSERPRERSRDRNRDQRRSRYPEDETRTSRNHSRDRRRHHRSSPSPSPPADRSKRKRDSERRDLERSRPSPSADRSLRREPSVDNGDPPVEKQKPNFSQTGLLAAATNTLNNTVLKYSEPSEARLPPSKPIWKLFVFKDAAIVDTITLNPRSCWLIGRDRAVADMPVDHPSCSKQHAVLQFRHIVKTGEFGDKEAGVRLYVLDLDSANGTRLNKIKIEGRRYVEIKEGDLITFGESTREYVVMLDRG